MTRLQAIWKALGWPGVAGLAALGLAVLAVLAGQRWDAQAAALQAEAQALRAKARPAAATAAPVSVQQWQAALPTAATRQQRLADLLELAIRLDLNGARTEHRLASGDGLERLRVSMPLTGNYAQIRRFIAAALAHDPALSLDAVKLRRASPVSADVDAELQWSLHGRAAP
ncbi:GspMb/PilO family protein [Roseateles sp. DC23W]|uniref:GspMb/PilO family protein n=1 Tax=Pelomonas dachongensis TaxID=3299029 RepID=A0ABW7ELI5_9BURK